MLGHPSGCDEPKDLRFNNGARADNRNIGLLNNSDIFPRRHEPLKRVGQFVKRKNLFG